MRTDVIYESIDGKHGVRIEQYGEFMQFLTMRNGYQWSGMPVDRQLLLSMHAAIESALEATADQPPPRPLIKGQTELNQFTAGVEEYRRSGPARVFPSMDPQRERELAAERAAGVKGPDHG